MQCLGCAKRIVQVGIKVVVYDEEYGVDAMKLTRSLFRDAGVEVRRIKG